MRNLATLVILIGFPSVMIAAYGQYDTDQEIDRQIEIIKKNFLESNLNMLEQQIEYFGEDEVQKMIFMIETGDFDDEFFSTYMNNLLALKLNLIDSSLKTAEYEINLLELPQDEKQKLINEFRDMSQAVKNKIILENEYHKSNISLVDNIVDISIISIPLILEHQNEIEEFSNDVSNTVIQQLENNNEGGGCLIATAAFGSEMAPQVQFLRQIRDNTVMNTESGATFMTGFNQFYYSFSPYVADYERENPVFKEAVKVTLTPLLTSLTLLNYVEIDSEEEMLGYGIGIILLNVGMYFVAPAVLIISLKKKLQK